MSPVAREIGRTLKRWRPRLRLRSRRGDDNRLLRVIMFFGPLPATE